jgi:hypothetical protein
MVFFLLQPGTYSSAREARIGNVAGLLSSVPRCGTGRVEFQIFSRTYKGPFFHRCFALKREATLLSPSMLQKLEAPRANVSAEGRRISVE